MRVRGSAGRRSPRWRVIRRVIVWRSFRAPLIRFRGSGSLTGQVLVEFELLLGRACRRAVGSGLRGPHFWLGALPEVLPRVIRAVEKGGVLEAETGRVLVMGTGTVCLLHDEGPRGEVELLKASPDVVRAAINSESAVVGHGSWRGWLVEWQRIGSDGRGNWRICEYGAGPLLDAPEGAVEIGRAHV